MGRFFGRKTKDKNEDENICPYCSHQNELDATVCKLCYYELGKTQENKEKLLMMVLQVAYLLN